MAAKEKDNVGGKAFLVMIGESNFKELAKICAKGPLDPEWITYENAGGNTALLVAAQRGQEKFAFELIKILYNNSAMGSIAVNHANKQQMTALMIASASGFGTVVEYLLEAGAEFELKNEEGKTALDLSSNPACTRYLEARIAARRAAEKVLEIQQTAKELSKLINAEKFDETAITKYVTTMKWKEAINFSPDPDTVNSPFLDLIMRAKSVDLVNIMVKLGALISMPDAKRRTPVMKIVMMDRKPSYPTTKLSRDMETIRSGMLKVMLESKDKDHYNMADHQGYTCLMWAAIKNHPEDIVAILDKGYADPDMKQQTIDPKQYRYRGLTIGDQQKFNDAAIIFAAKRHHYECINALLDGGADINLIGFDGMTAFMWQMYFAKIEGIKLLREKGANPNMQLDGNIDIYVANPDSRVSQGLTGFTLCADLSRPENLEAMKYVMLQDIEVPPPPGEEFLEDDDGELTIPVPKKNIFGESLPSIPIDINLCQTNRANAVQTLCRKSNQLKDQTLLFEVIQLLISRGCDVNNRTTEGMTPLMWCVEYDNRPLARLLLNAKADPRIQDRYHRDCFKLAGKNDALKSFIASYNIAGT